MAIGRDQRRTGVKPYVRLIGDQWIITETLVGHRVGDHHNVRLQYGLGAKGRVARSLRLLNANPGLEPLPVGIHETDERNRRPADQCCQAAQVVEFLFWKRAENSVPLKSFDSRRFVFG